MLSCWFRCAGAGDAQNRDRGGKEVRRSPPESSLAVNVVAAMARTTGTKSTLIRSASLFAPAVDQSKTWTAALHNNS